MLVICNGAAKSGSTWLYNIVDSMIEFKWPDDHYISRSNTKHPTIKEKFLADFIAKEDLAQNNFISKNHYSREFHRSILLSSPNTRIIDMSRDTRDVIVSSYYDSCRRNGFSGTFSDYYWQSGRLLVDYMKRYHDVWDVKHRQIHLTSFEALKTDFADEVGRIGEFLGLALTAEDINRIDEQTNINALRTNYQDDSQYNTEKNPFFRKGVIGDWQNHFNPQMIKDYDKIAQQGLGKFDFVYLKNRLVQKITNW